MSETRPLPLLRSLPQEVRLLAAMIMLTLSVGYIHALVYVYQTTRMVPHGIEQRYRGTETASDSSAAPAVSSEALEDSAPTSSTEVTKNIPAEIEYEKSLPEMLNIIHTHILTMTFIFALSGCITLMTDSISRRMRKTIVIEPFIGILVTFAGLWLMRYVHPAFSWLVSVSGTIMALAFAMQGFALIKELRTK